LWAEMPVCVSGALSRHIPPVGLLIGSQLFASSRPKPAQF
jgi:hypothetical protein